MITPQQALARLVEQREIFHDEMLSLMRQIMSGELTQVQIAGIITGLRVKKETVGEIAAAAISSMDSPFIRRPIRNPPICAGVAAPVMINCITSRICGPVRLCRSVIALMADCMSIRSSGTVASDE